jgi:hypothetical protein
VASLANELIDGRHDFLRGSGFAWVQTGATTRKPLLKLFSGAAPDKFSLCKMVHLFKSRQTALRGRRI